VGKSKSIPKMHHILILPSSSIHFSPFLLLIAAVVEVLERREMLRRGREAFLEEERIEGGRGQRWEGGSANVRSCSYYWQSNHRTRANNYFFVPEQKNVLLE